MREYILKTEARNQFLDITGWIQEAVREGGMRDGICVVFVPHTTAGLTINENADPSVQADLCNIMARLVPPAAGYRHLEGNSDSHAKTSMFGPSLTLIVEDGQLQLGTWQGVYFCEFDGPRNRKFWVKLVKTG